MLAQVPLAIRSSSSRPTRPHDSDALEVATPWTSPVMLPAADILEIPHPKNTNVKATLPLALSVEMQELGLPRLSVSPLSSLGLSAPRRSLPWSSDYSARGLENSSPRGASFLIWGTGRALRCARTLRGCGKYHFSADCDLAETTVPG